MSGLPGLGRRQLHGSSRMEHMTIEQILAQAFMMKEVEVNEPVAVVGGWCRVLPRVPMGPPSTPDKQNAVTVQATRTAECQTLCLPFASGYTYAEIAYSWFQMSQRKKSTYWTLVNSLNLHKELMDVHQSDISKMLPFSTSNLVSFMFIKSRHFTEAYFVLLHKTSHTSCVLFVWFLHAGSRESTPSVSLR